MQNSLQSFGKGFLIRVFVAKYFLIEYVSGDK